MDGCEENIHLELLGAVHYDKVFLSSRAYPLFLFIYCAEHLFRLRVCTRTMCGCYLTVINYVIKQPRPCVYMSIGMEKCTVCVQV